MAKVKVPKRVAGVKVPKELRKQAKRALDLIESPAARDLALAGLAIAAEKVIDRGRAKQGNGKRLQDVLKDGLDGLELGEVLRAAAIEGARRFLEGFDEGQRPGKAPAKPASAARPARSAKAASASKPARSSKPASAARPARSAKPASATKPARSAKPASATKTGKAASAAKGASPAKTAKSAGAAKKPTPKKPAPRKPSGRRAGAAAG